MEARQGDRMTGPAFRAFQATRPDHERWELLAGVPMKATRPTIAHGIIAGNLQRLLMDALENADPALVAVQRGALEHLDGDTLPEADVAVIDADFTPTQRFASRAYVLAQVVSETDDVPLPGSPFRASDARREAFLGHEHCRAILAVQEQRMEVALDVRTRRGWTRTTVTGGAAKLSVTPFGLRCYLADLYERTPMARRVR
jgi:Putative restriction endonuclease